MSDNEPAVEPGPSEPDFRTTVERAAIGIGHIALDGRWVLVNDCLCEMVGYSRDELLHLRFTDITHPDDRTLQNEDLFRLLAGSIESYALEKRYVRKDGSIIWAHPSVSLVRTPDGTPDYLITIIENITERKRLEGEVRESRERFESAFIHAAIGMALVGLDGRWLKVNDALCRLSGYSEAELLTSSFQDITHPDDLDTDLAYARQLIAGEIRSYQMEKRYIHKRGHIVWILLSVSLVHDDEGRPWYFVAQIQDITERKRAEAHLTHQALHDPLTGLANRSLLYDRLRHAIQSAKRYKTMFSLLFIDLDGFKMVNDTLGHQTGDLVLQHVAARLRGILRESDTIARLGGDEFAILLPGVGVTSTATVIEKLRSVWDEPFILDGRRISLSGSIGIATYPKDGRNAETLLHRADTDMYDMKRLSRVGHGGWVATFDSPSSTQRPA